jgi:hypothetical protein
LRISEDISAAAVAVVALVVSVVAASALLIACALILLPRTRKTPPLHPPRFPWQGLSGATAGWATKPRPPGPKMPCSTTVGDVRGYREVNLPRVLRSQHMCERPRHKSGGFAS